MAQNQPPYTPGYPPASPQQAPQVTSDEEQEKPVYSPSEAPPAEPAARAKKPSNLGKFIDGIYSCGAGCTEHTLESTLEDSKRRKRFLLCIMGSLVSQWGFLWIFILLLQTKDLFGPTWEDWKAVARKKMQDKANQVGAEVADRTHTPNDASLQIGLACAGILIYAIIIIIIFRLLNCGRRAPINWIFVILGYLCILGSCIALCIPYPFVQYLLFAIFMTLLILTLVLLCCNFFNSSWLGYVLALITSLFSASIGLVWFYCGDQLTHHNGTTHEELKQLKHKCKKNSEDLDEHSAYACAIFFIAVFMGQFFVHEIRMLMAGRRMEVREDEACIISCIL